MSFKLIIEIVIKQKKNNHFEIVENLTPLASEIVYPTPWCEIPSHPFCVEVLTTNYFYQIYIRIYSVIIHFYQVFLNFSCLIYCSKDPFHKLQLLCQSTYTFDEVMFGSKGDEDVNLYFSTFV